MTNQKETWQDRFEHTFGGLYKNPYASDFKTIDYDVSPEIKSFIKSELDKHREEIKEKIEKLVKSPCKVGVADGDYYDENENYNKALSDIKNII